MSLQIRKVVLYNPLGEVREVPFRQGTLNVLTGASKTGKSAIIDIIEYCISKQNCAVADGVQRNVAWFATLLAADGREIFVARRSPLLGERGSSDIYVELGTSVAVPSLTQLSKNISRDELVGLLSRESGIRDNRHVPRRGQTRLPLQANIKHAMFLCVQDQNDIDHRARLFHGQDDNFRANDIRHTIPYFLGAVSEGRLEQIAQLEGLYRELRSLQRKVAPVELDTAVNDMAATLLEEAKLVGLAPLDDVVESPLSQLISILDGQDGSNFPVSEGTNQLDQLYAVRQRLRSELERIRGTIQTARAFASDQERFVDAAEHHRSRLQALQLFKSPPDELSSCPVCNSRLAVEVPNVTHLRVSIEKVAEMLEGSEASRPRVSEYLANLQNEEQSTVSQLRSNADTIRALQDEIDRARVVPNDMLVQARVQGKIEQFIGVSRSRVDAPDQKSSIVAIERKIEELEDALSDEMVHENVETFLGFVSDYITEYASTLRLEYSENRIRLDLGRLTLVADTRNGALLMERMGSGENWVGYHIAAHLGLHRWFRERSRPVPGFMIFDQPSQAHYPRSKEDQLNDVIRDDEDEAAVRELYRLLSLFPQQFNGEMQIIALDHASFPEKWFQDAIVEEWRDGQGLLPRHWMTSSEPEAENAPLDHNLNSDNA